MLQQLLSNVTGMCPDSTKVATLESLGYMCDEWEPEEMDQTQTNQILTCIVDGLRKDRPSEIRHAAGTALNNSLDFTHSNFETKGERDMIMTVICEATQCTTTAVRKVAFECISNIASLYYEKLQDYMHALFDITMKAMKEDSVEVVLQAIEFWSTLCDEENDLNTYAMYAQGLDDGSQRTSSNYVRAALQYLVPVLLECLMKQDEDADEDDWGIGEICVVV